MTAPGYAELHCLSHFSFGRGASSARELFERAKRNGYQALAITDECTLAGIVRALEASRETGVKLIVGTEVTLDDGLKLVLLAQDQSGYSAISQLITQARRRAEKGSYTLGRADLANGLPGTLALWIPAPRRTRNRAAGCAPAGMIACGWPCSCIAAPMTRRGCGNCAHSARDCNCRWSPPATCTCMSVVADWCRTR